MTDTTGHNAKRNAKLGLAACVLALAYGIHHTPKGEAAAAPIEATQADTSRDAIEAARRTQVRNRLRSLKASLRDPASLTVSKLHSNADGSSVCVLYRARNGFGGQGVEAVRIDSSMHQLRSAKAWQAQCRGMLNLQGIVGTTFL